jgi:hypothetical protein
MTFFRASAAVLMALPALMNGAEPPGREAEREALQHFVARLPWEEHLPDASLIERFATLKQQFELLREMFMHDRGLELIARERTEPANVEALGIARERLARYQRLLVELKVKFVYGRPDRTAGATFVVTSRGVGGSGSAKGFAWLPSPPSLTAGDLDAYVAQALARPEKARSKQERMAVTAYTVYRPLGGKWHLFYSN